MTETQHNPNTSHVVETPEKRSTKPRSAKERFLALQKADELYEFNKKKREALKYAEMQRRSFAAQEAVLPENHPFAQMVRKVVDKITEAELRLRTQKGRDRDFTSNDCTLQITKRNVVNAFTLDQGKAIFFEAGFFTMLDAYLRSQKGFGLSEDHVAALHGHEISHSDGAAEVGYMNEEYCDVQGLVLMAEAGYNPYAMLDIEDFLVWLEGGEDLVQKKSEADEGDTKHHAILPSHPHPENRRLVIINNLENKEHSFQNQAKAMIQIPVDDIDSLEQQMRSWSTRASERLLQSSDEDSLRQLKGCRSISEILDWYTGRYLTYKAQVLNELTSDTRFVDHMTLHQAIFTELRRHIEEDEKSSIKIESTQTTQATGEIYKQDIRRLLNNADFQSHDLLVGGMTKCIRGQISTEVKPSERKTSEVIKNEFDTLRFSVHDFTPKEYYGDKLTNEEKRAYDERAAENARERTKKLKEPIENLYTVLKKFEGQIDVGRLLSGDFFQHLELANALIDVGINNFDFYLRSQREKLRKINFDRRLETLYPERSRQLFVNAEVLSKSVEEMDDGDVRSLLESTMPYRIAVFAERAPLLSSLTNDEFDHALDARLEAIAKTLVDDADSAEVLKTIFIYTIRIGKFPYSQYNEPTHDQMVNSLVMLLPQHKEKIYHILCDIQAKLQTFRVEPSNGDDLICAHVADGVLGKNARSGLDIGLQKGKQLGLLIDTIRLYMGKVHISEDKITKKFILQQDDNDPQAGAFMEKIRQEAIPVFGNGEVGDHFDYQVDQEKYPDDLDQMFQMLKNIVVETRYSYDSVKKLILLKGISLESKMAFFHEALEKGDVQLFHIFKSLFDQSDSRRFSTQLHRDGFVDNLTHLADEETKYHFMISLIRSLPTAPIPCQHYDALDLFQTLFNQKMNLAKIKKVLPLQKEFNKEGGLDMISGLGVDLYEGASDADRARKELDFIFEFVREGGDIQLSRAKNGVYDNLHINCLQQGAQVDILGIVERLGFPIADLQSRIDVILTQRRSDGYTPYERDKWDSLIAYCLQPKILNDEYSTYTGVAREFYLRENNADIKIQLNDNGAVEKVISHIEALPQCSYRDRAIRALFTKLEKTTIQLPPELIHKLHSLAIGGLSGIAWDTIDHPKSFKEEAFDPFSILLIPHSEKYRSDQLNAMCVSKNDAAIIWRDMVVGRMNKSCMSPLHVDYRKSEKFRGMDASLLEKQIFHERIDLIREMPKSAVKDALMIFALETADENRVRMALMATTEFSNELASTVREHSRNCTSEQAKQYIFKKLLSMELKEQPISAISIRARFASRDDFLKYVTAYLPEKTIFRDSMVMLAVEAYPLKLADRSVLNNLLYSLDYSTSSKSVLVQRGAQELVRSVKSNERITTEMVRELVLWFVDDQLQIHDVDEFVLAVADTQVGKKLINSVLDNELRHSEDSSLLMRSMANATRVAFREIFPRLPILVRKRIFRAILSAYRSDGSERMFGALLQRAGMPSALVEELKTQVELGVGSETTFNSALEGMNLSNPNAKEIFFDLMLGTHGVLEEKEVDDVEKFTLRFDAGFEGSQMHRFIDDVLGIAFRNGKWSNENKKVAKIISHSLLEAMSPPRRTSVMYNLVTKLKQVDFSELDEQQMKAKVMQVALGSIGLLGAKMGQIDELIPKDLRSGMSSFKHDASPMSKLMVTDILAQEGLSGEYIVESVAGAASTACGYVIQAPSGERQFAKVLRPDVMRDWKEDFKGVKHMLKCLQKTGVLKADPGPIIMQLEKLVSQELQTKREVENVVRYIEESQISGQKLIRPVKMPLQRVDADGNVKEQPPESMVILEELLGREEWIELSRLQNPTQGKSDYEEIRAQQKLTDFQSIYRTIVNDFLLQALVNGHWHSDLHDGNIMISKGGGVSRIVGPEDLVLIDFGQVGSVEHDVKKKVIIQFLMGMALLDREEIAKAILTASTLKDDPNVNIDMIKKELPVNPLKIPESITKIMAKYKPEEYMTNFLKASLNILPYLRQLPFDQQIELILPYIPHEQLIKGRTKVIGLVANATRIFK